jgi:hypothetical protein
MAGSLGAPSLAQRLVELAPSVSAPQARQCDHQRMAAWSDEPRAGTTQGYELRCIECGAVPSDSRARGWRGFRWDEPFTDDPPAVAFYCPQCAEREFS